VRFGNGKAIKPGGTGVYPVFGSNGIIGGSDEFLHENGVVIGRVGAYCGAVVYCPTKFWASDNTLVAYPSSDQVDTQFLYHLLVDANLSRYAGGAAQPLVTQTVLKQVEVRIPELDAQLRIAGILSAYDELIENSQQRIKILEAMARALYREWFIYFRYPSHELVPLVPSSLGDIPSGWEVVRLSDFVDTQYGYTESTNAEPVGPKYLRGMDINKTSFIDWSMVPYCPISPEDHEKYRLRVGDILVIRMADPGKVGIVEQEVDAVFASYLIRVSPKNCRLSTYFLFYLMESAEYYAFITGASTGATRKSASAGVIAEYEFVLPPQELVEKFERRVSEIRLLLTTTLTKIVNLRRTRDLLLPRLLSGQIEVEANDL
jgi:type I restriction enzyme S subunit